MCKLLKYSSSEVVSKQVGPHRQLANNVQKHLASTYRSPVPQHTRSIYLDLKSQGIIGTSPLVLDSGCGTAESTLKLANSFPGCTVIGIDKSEKRLAKTLQKVELPSNCHIIRADLVGFWQLLLKDKISLKAHNIFYPNPWPKPGHFKRRWHGHPVFPTLLSLGGLLELRSNWRVYVEEFAWAVELATGQSAEVEVISPSEMCSPFERKYSKSKHSLYRYRLLVEDSMLEGMLCHNNSSIQ